MRSPAVKRLVGLLNLDRGSALLIKYLCDARDDRDELERLINERCPDTAAYAASCHNDPYFSRMWRTTLVLHALDKILGTHGVEGIGEGDHTVGYAPPYEYLNAGDTYATTLIYKRSTDTVSIGCWGDIAERMYG